MSDGNNGRILLPKGVPQIGGPETESAEIGGCPLTFFKDPAVGVTFAPNVPMQEVAARMTIFNVFINAFCREFVAMAKYIDALETRVTALEANAITKVERIDSTLLPLSPGDSGELEKDEER